VIKKLYYFTRLGKMPGKGPALLFYARVATIAAGPLVHTMTYKQPSALFCFTRQIPVKRQRADPG